ncbi:hypothetical protein AB751O23_AA_00060 [Chlamydiales bacterium SCGC AB-751-O23]|jgi:hypothetical protein|nr:hypothetical protein AB751O23_AA_00060 [Chlamydiales bacterium SCGC AB-751-O23]
MSSMQDLILEDELCYFILYKGKMQGMAFLLLSNSVNRVWRTPYECGYWLAKGAEGRAFLEDLEKKLMK